MLLREDGEAVVCIGQPSHAWVSGQLARAWGNERFERPQPREEVCLAAEQHDVGMAAWDLAPERNPATGRPRSFMEMDLATHLGLWTKAPRRLLAQSRYATLLVSLHGAALYRRRDLGAAEPETAAAIRAYLAEQEALQERLASTLRADPVTAEWARSDRVERNRSLLWTLDSLSLALLLCWSPFVVRAAPGAGEPVDLSFVLAADGRRATVEPWPFEAPDLTVRAEGRRLEGRHETDAAVREALDRAPWVTLELALAPV